MRPATLFCVQQRSAADPSQYGPGKTVEAACPLEAAHLVLGTEVALSGNRSAICARVVRFDQQYRPVTTMIYGHAGNTQR